MEIMSLCSPNYEPRDKSGNIIYGRPYPLYNFSVAFYYKLDKGVKKYRIHIPEKDKSKLDKVLEINKLLIFILYQYEK